MPFPRRASWKPWSRRPSPFHLNAKAHQHPEDPYTQRSRHLRRHLSSRTCTSSRHTRCRTIQASETPETPGTPPAGGQAPVRDRRRARCGRRPIAMHWLEALMAITDQFVLREMRSDEIPGLPGLAPRPSRPSGRSIANRTSPFWTARRAASDGGSTLPSCANRTAHGKSHGMTRYLHAP